MSAQDMALLTNAAVAQLIVQHQHPLPGSIVAALWQRVSLPELRRVVLSYLAPAELAASSDRGGAAAPPTDSSVDGAEPRQKDDVPAKLHGSRGLCDAAG
jgi:hypothetical protein